MAQAVLARGARVHVFATVDHCKSECVGLHAAFGANRWKALKPVRQGAGRHFGPAGAEVAAGLKLWHDLGPNYMAEDFQREIAFLGIEASPSFVRQPEGNGIAERFFRTLKEQLLLLRTFLHAGAVTGGAASVQDLVQRELADPAPRPSNARAGTSRSARRSHGRQRPARGSLTAITRCPKAVPRYRPR